MQQQLRNVMTCALVCGGALLLTTGCNFEQRKRPIGDDPPRVLTGTRTTLTVVGSSAEAPVVEGVVASMWTGPDNHDAPVVRAQTWSGDWPIQRLESIELDSRPPGVSLAGPFHGEHLGILHSGGALLITDDPPGTTSLDPTGFVPANLGDVYVLRARPGEQVEAEVGVAAGVGHGWLVRVHDDAPVAPWEGGTAGVRDLAEALLKRMAFEMDSGVGNSAVGGVTLSQVINHRLHAVPHVESDHIAGAAAFATGFGFIYSSQVRAGPLRATIQVPLSLHVFGDSQGTLFGAIDPLSTPTVLGQSVAWRNIERVRVSVNDDGPIGTAMAGAIREAVVDAISTATLPTLGGLTLDSYLPIWLAAAADTPTLPDAFDLVLVPEPIPANANDPRDFQVGFIPQASTPNANVEPRRRGQMLIVR